MSKAILFSFVAWMVSIPVFATQPIAEQPNIIFIMCDDLGYGDIHCLAPETSKIATPCADQLAREGMIFTDAHSGSSVCTPTRYGIMTGRYSWRTRLQRGVVTGFAPSLIAKDRPTVASFLKEQSYHTGVVGKWHLDFQYLDPQTGEAYTQKQHKTPPVGAKIPDGPVHRGFDYYHGFHHARNMEAVIENDEVIAHDPVINMLPRLTRKSVEYIDERAKDKQPFFLYVPLGSPHTPIVPSKAWQGKSPLGAYGDFVMETDAVVGAISSALERHGMTDNTLVIFTSDNGCSKAAGIDELAAKGHKVSAHLRGSKADIWDGGHRVPFIARWPGHIKPGSTSAQLICLVDLFATVEELTGGRVTGIGCEDSVSILPALAGNPIESTRSGVIHHSISGHFAYRQGKWKLCLARASGGWSSPKENEAPKDGPQGQLYDLETDPSETSNLYEAKPEIVARLVSRLKSDVLRGRSTKGPNAKNDVEDIVLWKSASQAKSGGGKPRKKKVTLNEKADGYRGIWYMNQPSNDEYVYKYSGGLGTYCAKHRPFAIYCEQVHKTFFCFGGTTKGSNRKLLHMVSYFDHATKTVPRPTVLLDKQTSDAHDNPVISVDDTGHIWVFSTSHGTSRPSYIHRSVRPFDVDQFEMVAARRLDGGQLKPITNFSYMQAWHEPDSGFLNFFTRYGYPAKRTICFMSSRDGIRWSRWQRIAAIDDGHYQISGVGKSKAGSMFNYHPAGKGLNWRTNLYYVETADHGATWQNVDGRELSLPLTKTRNDALVRDYEAEGLNVYLKDVRFDEDDHPVLLYITSKGYESGPKNDPRTWTIARWTGQRWLFNSITTSDNNYDFGELWMIAKDDWRVIGPTESGPQPYNPGGEVAMWTSRDQGLTWSRTRHLTQDSSMNHTYVRRALNAHPDFIAIWADGHGRKPSDSRLHFCDSDGNVFRLPFAMDTDSATPLLIE